MRGLRDPIYIYDKYNYVMCNFLCWRSQFLYLSSLIRLFVVYSIRAHTERYYNKWEYIYIIYMTMIWNDLECITCYNKKNHVLLICVSRFSMIGLSIHRWLSLKFDNYRVIFFTIAKHRTLNIPLTVISVWFSLCP